MKMTKKTNHYRLTMDHDVFEKNSDFLGRLKANYSGSEFNLFDNGKGIKNNKNNNEPLRTQWTSIKYETSLFGMRRPRKMKTYIPQVNDTTYEITPFKFSKVILG